MARARGVRRQLVDGTVIVANNKRVLGRMTRRHRAESDEKRRAKASAAAAKRRDAFWGRQEHKRALFGELVENWAGAVWSSVWRRGA